MILGVIVGLDLNATIAKVKLFDIEEPFLILTRTYPSARVAP